ncbi:YkgJ family cysteine cluster protein [Streptomyces violaceusniger]|uniref:Fe-S oxidoreductase n=1 Tax=Streptomyces violaceusniger (strain Tu 4113) TaxID=653045 RepID=G2PHW8_STRV4|nr:YkgJ family cysteine cluster protein [Streptomyces violaceusniger]AEM88919.1 protein of unknown function UPF0153 [Streptomyces violaceusniger Tu 4113]
MARRSDQDAALDAVYDQIPDVGCKGLCKASCGPIEMSYRERSRIRERTGITVESAAQSLKKNNLTCSALTDEGRCGAYEYRPAICRLWGASEDMPCRWGCRPTDGQPPLSARESYRLLGAANDAGGGSTSSLHNFTEADVLNAYDQRGEEAIGPASARRENIRQGEESDYFREASQDIPAAFVSPQVIGRYTTALRVLNERQQRPYA